MPKRAQLDRECSVDTNIAEGANTKQMIGIVLRRLRERKDLTQVKLAKKAKLTAVLLGQDGDRIKEQSIHRGIAGHPPASVWLPAPAFDDETERKNGRHADAYHSRIDRVGGGSH